MWIDPGFAGGRPADDVFQRFVDSIKHCGIYMLDPRGTILTWNRGAEINTGSTGDEMLGKPMHVLFTPEDNAAGVPDAILCEASLTGSTSRELWRMHKSGRRFWAHIVLTEMLDEEGSLLGFAQVVRDLTEVRNHEAKVQHMERMIREERDWLHGAAESSLDALYICSALRDPAGEIEDFMFTYLNRNVEKMVSIPRSVLLGGRMCSLMPLNRERGLFELYKQVVLTGIPLVQEFAVDEDYVTSGWVCVQAVRVGEGIAITASDITERKRREQKTLHLAHHDALTGLPNRSVLHERIQEAIHRADLSGTRVGIVWIDLDGFKNINDTLGHATGDAVLLTAATRLLGAVRATDSVIRVGGDEFVAVLTDMKDGADLKKRGQSILRKMQRPLELHGRSIQITSSLGAAVYPDSSVTVEELLVQADAAMYEAKRQGKNRLAHYCPDIQVNTPRHQAKAGHRANVSQKVNVSRKMEVTFSSER